MVRVTVLLLFDRTTAPPPFPFTITTAANEDVCRRDALEMAFALHDSLPADLRRCGICAVPLRRYSDGESYATSPVVEYTASGVPVVTGYTLAVMFTCTDAACIAASHDAVHACHLHVPSKTPAVCHEPSCRAMIAEPRMRCPRCKAIAYCSYACQTQDAEAHAPFCKLRQ